MRFIGSRIKIKIKIKIHSFLDHRSHYFSQEHDKSLFENRPTVGVDCYSFLVIDDDLVKIISVYSKIEKLQAPI